VYLNDKILKSLSSQRIGHSINPIISCEISKKNIEILQLIMAVDDGGAASSKLV